MRATDRNGLKFMMTDLRVGLNLARFASSDSEPEEENEGLGMHAPYDTAVRLGPKLELTKRQRQELDQKIQKQICHWCG